MRACIPRHAPGCVIPRAGGFNHRENERGLEREREGWWRRWGGHHRHFRNYARRILIKNARGELGSSRRYVGNWVDRQTMDLCFDRGKSWYFFGLIFAPASIIINSRQNLQKNPRILLYFVLFFLIIIV